jgi:sec-independent protein translocase protein TatC
MLFVAPALTRRETKNVTMLLVGVVVCFITGTVFTYLILLPPAMNFLLNFNTDIAEPMISIGNYVSVVVRLTFWIGVVFNLPILMFFLSKIGIVNPKWLARNWKWSFLVAFGLGAVITPTMDPFNQTLVAAPIIVLYFIGIALAQLARRGKNESNVVPAVTDEE